MDTVDWNPKAYATNSSAQEAWGSALHEKLKLCDGETIIDLGCGDGRLTAALARQNPSGHTIGLDASPAMVEYARTAYADLPGLEFHQADARSFHVDMPADALVSSAALHWIAELDQAFQASWHALRPGGRLLFQMGGTGNIAEVEEAAWEVVAQPQWHDFFKGFELPWHLHSCEEAQEALSKSGFETLRVEFLERDMVHENPEAFLGWMRATWFGMTARVPEARREALLAAIGERFLERHPTDAAGRTHVRMVRLEVEAVRPA